MATQQIEPRCAWCDVTATNRRALYPDHERDCWYHRSCKKEFRHVWKKGKPYKPEPRKLKPPTNDPRKRKTRTKGKRRAA